MDLQIKYYADKLQYEMDSADLWEALESDTNIIVVDTRKPLAYTKQHIPTAINMPHREMSELSTKDWDRSKLYVCYCDGIGCNASTKGAYHLARLGFKVKELIGGIEWWKFDGHATIGDEPTEGKEILCAC